MRDNLRVSVVVPVYNEEKYLANCLNSLVKQSVPADEIIVVDNNSTDGSVAIAQKFPVRIVHEKKQGMIHARNRGFNEAKHEIIARTDADTILPKNWVKRVKKAFEDETVVGVSGPANFYELPKYVEYARQKKFASSLIKSYNKIVKQILKHDCLYGPNIVINKKANLRTCIPRKRHN